MFVGIAPWARDRFQKCNFVELDTSFRASRLYGYCVPAEDLGRPIEKYRFLQSVISGHEDARARHGPRPNDLERKPYLSDEHPRLVSACSRMTQFLCTAMSRGWTRGGGLA
jgi:hypothetical protein